MRPRISIRGLARPSIRPLVRPSVTLSSKSMKNGLLRILNDLELDSAGRGRKRDEEEGGTRRKLRERNENVKKIIEKNVKVARGRIVDYQGLVGSAEAVAAYEQNA